MPPQKGSPRSLREASFAVEAGFTPLFVIIGVILIIFLGLVIQHITGFGLPQRQSFNKESGSNLSGDYQTPENCQTGEVKKFEAEFTDLEKINAINPIGGIGGGSPGRSYIGVKDGMEAPIYSPTDAILENIIYARRGGPSTPGEYGLYIRLSCDVTLLFDHIDRVSDRIKEYAPKEPADTSRVNFDPVNLSIKKGELLGYSDGTPQARTFDFLITDNSKPATHINPKRWEWEQAIYSQCPYDYFSDDLKEKYYAKIGEVNQGVFTQGEGCGQLSHDKLGTISGGWFKGDSTDQKGDYLAIARHEKEVHISIKKDGQFGPDSIMRDYSPKAYPEDVSVGEEECFYDQNENKWAYVKLVSEEQLSFARGSGNCPGSFPNSQSELWER